jgi:surface carbohydrate biosynthesis protein
MKNLKKLIQIIINTKFEFHKPKKKYYLVYDKTGTFILNKYLKKSKVILHTRNESFNLYVILINFLQGKFRKKEYLETFIKLVNPKIIITAIDNNPNFYLLKIRKDQKKILIQTATKSPVYDSSIFKIDNGKTKVVKKRSYNVDKIFVFNEYIGKYFKKLNAKKVISIGSFRSNHFHRKKRKKIDFLFISSWNNANPSTIITSNFTFAEYQKFHDITFKNLSKFIEKNNYKIHILSKHQSKGEYDYYDHFFKNINWKFIKNNRKNPYHIVDQSKVIINFHSTLGYESFSRGNKTVFINPFGSKECMKTTKFGWPLKLEKNGPFWSSSNSYNDLEKLLNKVIFMKKKKFNLLYFKYVNKLMPYNKNNSKFIYEILN